MRTLSPLSCFLPENLPLGVLPIYAVDPNTVSLVWEKGAPQTIKGVYRIVVPMEDLIVDIEAAANNMIMVAASMNPSVHVLETFERMDKLDLEFAGFISCGSDILAVARSEYIGRHPKRYPQEGLAIYIIILAFFACSVLRKKLRQWRPYSLR